MATGTENYILSKQITCTELLKIPHATALKDNEDILIAPNWYESNQLRKSNPDKLVFTQGDLVLPAINIDNELRTIQTIQPNGLKMF